MTEPDYYYYEGKTDFSSKFKSESIEMYALALLGFMVPFLIGHPQILVGIAVNALIVRSASNLPPGKALPILITPSIGALTRGLVFGPLTVYLVYMIPFIWLGNLILYQSFRIEKLRTHLFPTKLIVGSALKAIFLYAAAATLYFLGAVPLIFLTVFGVMQFVTAFLGGATAYFGENGFR